MIDDVVDIPVLVLVVIATAVIWVARRATMRIHFEEVDES